MTPTEHLIGFIAMASAIVAILVVGTLAAADILHFGRRGPAARTRQARSRRAGRERRGGARPVRRVLQREP